MDGTLEFLNSAFTNFVSSNKIQIKVIGILKSKSWLFYLNPFLTLSNHNQNSQLMSTIVFVYAWCTDPMSVKS